MLNVRGDETVAAAAAYYGQLDQPTRKALREQARRWAPTLIKQAVLGAHSKQQGAVASSGSTTLSGNGLVALFGSAGRLGGTSMRTIAAPYEFGTNDRERKTRYLSRHRISKKAMTVTRRTRRQLPPYRRTGYFAYPAVAETTPTLVGMWVKAIIEVAEARP
jgi:hypothetical protein